MAARPQPQLGDILPKCLNDIFSFRLPSRLEDKARRLLGIAPMSFYDRHVNESRRLRHVALLPTLVNDLTKHVDDRLAELKDHGEGPLPIRRQTRGHFCYSVSSYSCDEPSMCANLLYYSSTIASTCLALVSSWVIHPRAPQYFRCLTFDGPSHPPPRAEEPNVHFSIRFRPPHEIHPDVLSSIDDDVKGALKDWHGRDLVTWVFLPIAPHTEKLLRDLDRLSTLPIMPSASYHKKDYPPMLDDHPLPCDADVTPWTLSGIGAPLDASPSNDWATSVKELPGTITSFTSSPNVPESKFEEMRDSTPEGLAHMAWRLAVCQDTTIIVINCGNYERIAVRHRASNTLYISDMLDVTNSGYGKLHLGLQMAAVGDALHRYRQHRTIQYVPPLPSRLSLSKRTRAQARQDDGDLRRSKRQKLNNLMERARGGSKSSKREKQSFCEEVGSRPVALVRLSAGGLNSSIPASCLRTGDALTMESHLEFAGNHSTQKELPKPPEYFMLTLQSYISAGATGQVYAARLEITLPGGKKLSQNVAAKLSTSEEARDRLRREYGIYRHLWTHDVRRIPEIYGLFEDADDIVTILIMERAAFSFRQREPATLENKGMLTELMESDKAICLAAVDSIHRAGVVHRDLRPENLVVAQDGRPMVIDFDHACLEATDQLKEHEVSCLLNLLDGKSLETAARFVE
ncbi:hypothetical protein BDN72DRAFT_961625 [Pluteus cervinus]|uniref:Uncharacterized protein n=1 Tax=Pluteus cervinus TaxID=181527 RepID=A0ACD3AM01_9AGAR|nr:hypothetical protein BDN72DRAFT_961625 [Pluteus cervinus]